MAPQIPSALLRSAPSGNIFMTIDSAAGSTAAAPRPCTPRMMIRNVLLVASAQPSEAAENIPRPARQKEPAERERVRGHHPLQVRLREVQLDADRRERDVDDQHVHRGHEARHGEQREGPPPAGFAGWRGRGVRGDANVVPWVY